MPRVVLAPDKFKGTLTAAAVAEHLTTDMSVSKAYSLAQLTLINELTDAVFAS